MQFYDVNTGAPTATMNLCTPPLCNTYTKVRNQGESLQCARIARYSYTMSPPKSPQANPLETPLELGDPNCPNSRKLQTTFPSHNTHQAQLEKP